MPTIIVPLKDILTDADNPVDLTALPEAEAVRQIKGIYGFVSAAVEVEVNNGIATITLPDEKARQASQAMAKLEQASRLSQRGKYQQAISLFKDVLKVLPDNTTARRELAMALMETGNAQAAKQHLIRVLQLNPDDAWAYLILGNLYYQVENDLGSAERYFSVAFDLTPDDPYLLNSYAALMAKRGRMEEAISMFEQAIAHQPDYPNPRFGLALAQRNLQDLAGAMATLEGLFAAPASADPRHQPVYQGARAVYVELRRQRAKETSAEAMHRLRATMDAYTAETGIEVRVETDPALTTSAIVELAWRYRRPYHLIKLTKGEEGPYILAHEFEHVLMTSEARAAGRNRLFAVPEEITAKSLRAIEKDLRRIQNRTGLDARRIEEHGRFLIAGLANQLFNHPMDLVVDTRIHDKYPFLHDHQFVWLAKALQENLRSVTDREIRDISPTRILQGNIAMNTAMAMFVDDLFGGATDFASMYGSAGLMATGHRLYHAFREKMRSYQAGDEYDLVDAWAQELHMEDQYKWVPDSDVEVDSRASAAEQQSMVGGEGQMGREGGPTNPELLQDSALQMGAVMYMISALERFEHMSTTEITQIAGEIAVVGLTGLDYASPEQKYTLRYLPGERFSGLQLMCYMYVGFKQVWPEQDAGIPLHEAYESALKMYERKRNR